MNGQSLTQRFVGNPVLPYVLMIGVALLLGRVIGQEHWLYLVPFGLLVAIPLAIRWPVAMSLGIYAFLVPFDKISALGPAAMGATLPHLVGLGAGALLLATGFVGRRFVRPPKAAFWWSGFILWGATTALWAIDPDLVVFNLRRAVSLLLLYLVVVSIRLNGKELSSVVWLAVLGGVAAAAFTVYQYSQGVSYHSVLGLSDQRASLIVGEREIDPNEFAADLLLPLSCAIGLYLASRSKLRKLFTLVVIATISSGLYLTMSRGSLLALVVIGAVYLRRLRVDWRLWGILGVLGAITLAMPELFFRRLRGLYETGGAGRIEIWRVGLEALKHYAWLGAGWSNFSLAYNEYVQSANQFAGFGRGAHNLYLEMAVELGIIGLLLLLGAVISHLRDAGSCLRARSERDVFLLSLEAACWGMLTANFFLGTFWYNSFWLVWMLLAVAVRVHKDRAAGACP